MVEDKDYALLAISRLIRGQQAVYASDSATPKKRKWFPHLTRRRGLPPELRRPACDLLPGHLMGLRSRYNPSKNIDHSEQAPPATARFQRYSCVPRSPPTRLGSLF